MFAQGDGNLNQEENPLLIKTPKARTPGKGGGHETKQTAGENGSYRVKVFCRPLIFSRGQYTDIGIKLPNG